MLSIFKPLFSFRKYIWASKILHAVASSYVALVELDPNKPKKHIEKPRCLYFGAFEDMRTGKLTKEQILQATFILEKEGHAIIKHSEDFYLTILEVTKEGMIANHDGYYTKLIVNKAWKVIGIISGAALSLYGTVKWVLPLILKIFRKD